MTKREAVGYYKGSAMGLAWSFQSPVYAGGGNEKENLTVAQLILHCLGKPKSLIRLVADRPGHDRRYAIDCSRLRDLGWQPKVSFEEGIRKTVQWYRTHEGWWKRIKSGEFRTYYEQMYGRRLQEGVKGAKVGG
jgi:dTDP-glucose 4,6-dehydratase